MSDSTDIAVADAPQVPDLYRTPAFEFSAEDVALPRLKIGQYMSAFVQEDQVEAGALFTSLSQDDPDPITVDAPLRFHVLQLEKAKSISEDGELTVFDYNDPEAPEDAWVTYNYVVVLPEHDQDMPVKWLLTKTGRPAAQQINTVLAKNAAAGPTFLQAFDVETIRKENDKGKYFVPRIKHVEADAEHLAIAEKLAVMISPDAAAVQSSGAEPAI